MQTVLLVQDPHRVLLEGRASDSGEGDAAPDLSSSRGRQFVTLKMQQWMFQTQLAVDLAKDLLVVHLEQLQVGNTTCRYSTERISIGASLHDSAHYDSFLKTISQNDFYIHNHFQAPTVHATSIIMTVSIMESVDSPPIAKTTKHRSILSQIIANC